MGTRGLPSHDRLLSTIGRELAIKIVNVRTCKQGGRRAGPDLTSHWSVLSGAAATSPPPLKTRLEEHPEEVRFERYCRLLATELTDLQRQNLHKRIAEEYVHLERLEKSQTQP